MVDVVSTLWCTMCDHAWREEGALGWPVICPNCNSSSVLVTNVDKECQSKSETTKDTFA